MDVVEVIWKDAATYHENVDTEEAKQYTCASASTVGYLVKKDKEVVILAMTEFPDIRDVKFCWVIPICCVQEIRKLQRDIRLAF